MNKCKSCGAEIHPVWDYCGICLEPIPYSKNTMPTQPQPSNPEYAQKCTNCHSLVHALSARECPKCKSESLIMIGPKVIESELASTVEATIAERGKVYGDPFQSHTNIGLAWTGLLQQHYGITLDHPLPAALVAQMMVAFKIQRSARVYHADNYTDLAAYSKFAEDFQKRTDQSNYDRNE